MPDQAPEAIQEAVRHCLDRVSQGNTPLGVIAEFLGELRDQGWSDGSVRAVNAAVLKLLAGMVRPENSGRAIDE